MRPAPWNSRKWVRWTLFAAALALIAFVAGSFWLIRPDRFKAHAERTLSERIGGDVTIGELQLSFFPRPRFTGTNLVVRLAERADPPFVVIDRFWADLGPLSAWRGHLALVEIDGLTISVPPQDEDKNKDATDRDSGRRTAADRVGKAVVDHLKARHATLSILRRDPKKDPLVFEIHSLDVSDVGFDRVMAFSADLTNPVPQGRIESTGKIGPWNKEHPIELPVSGDYTFSAADLGTIHGIGGMLTSTGRYEGHLTRITVKGQASTPDFSLDFGGKPLPLTTSFHATVDGSDGTTVLDRVDAKLLETEITTQGRVENLPGPGRRNLELTATVTKGRIEDLLALVVDAPPALVGDVTLTSRIALPPGEGLVRDRLRLDGSFGMNQAKFSDQDVQAKLLELSRRSQGKDKDDPVSRAATRFGGKFTLASGVVTLKSLTFQVPGALVSLDGTYAVVPSELDFIGTLRMQASVSKAVGGFKSIFLKPFDWMFRKEGAGAVVPIQVTGTLKNPDVGISIKRALRGAGKKETKGRSRATSRWPGGV